MNVFYIAQLVHGVPILIEQTYTLFHNDEYIITARDSTKELLGGIVNQLPPVIHKRDTFGELVDALRWMEIEASKQRKHLVCNDLIEEQLEQLIIYAQEFG